MACVCDCGATSPCSDGRPASQASMVHQSGGTDESSFDDGVCGVCFGCIRGRLRYRLGGKTVCSNGDKAVVSEQEHRHGEVRQTRNSGGTAKTVQGRNGKAAVSQTEHSGVTTTKTTGGGEVKSKNGVGVAKTADGTPASRARTIRVARRINPGRSPGEWRCFRLPPGAGWMLPVVSENGIIR